MKIISFLGFQNYTETTYYHSELNLHYTTPFFKEALVHFYHPDTLIILLTEKVEYKIPDRACKTNWQALQDCLTGKVKIEPIKNIPEQNRPEDIWYIFEQVTNFLQDGDEVIFDITYGFRSIPIVDLAQDITQISQSLQLLRPVNLMEEAAKLPKSIQKATPRVSQELPPFKTLLKRVERDYSQFALSNSKNFLEQPKSFLKQSLKIARWYVEKGQIVQALSLMREWLPCLLCYHFNLDAFDKKNREEMELLLAGGKKNNRTSKYLEEWKKIEPTKTKRLKALWANELKLANLRNDVLHAGFHKTRGTVEDIIQKTTEILYEIEKIAQQWLD